jgi:hypothetical protein
MNASISSIAISANANARAAAPPQLRPPPKAEDVFKQIDAEGKGSVTASEAAAYLVKISPEGARKADAADSSSKLKQDIEQALGKADADGNGELSQAEFKQALAQGPAGRSQGAGRPHGPPPGAAGGAGGAGGSREKAAGASEAGSSSSASTSYEKEDANRDGKVTEPERQAYAVQHPKQAVAEAAQSVKTATVVPAVRAASDMALQRYQEVANSVE